MASNSQENEDSVDILPLPSSSQDSQDSQDSPDSPDSEPDELAPCDTDAGHPRFTRSSRASAAAKKKADESRQKNLYCSMCDVFISQSELPDHFRGHKCQEGLEKCQYCEKPVYTYILKRESEADGPFFYHTCDYESDDLPSAATPAGNDMNCNEINAASNE